MEILFLLVISTYIGVALYEFYKSSLFGQPTRECFINALVWPVEVYYYIKDIITRTYIDKDGP